MENMKNPQYILTVIWGESSFSDIKFDSLKDALDTIDRIDLYLPKLTYTFQVSGDIGTGFTEVRLLTDDH